MLSMMPMVLVTSMCKCIFFVFVFLNLLVNSFLGFFWFFIFIFFLVFIWFFIYFVVVANHY